MAGTRGKWWDAECAAPLRIEGLATQDENNKVTFRFMKGSGTQLKYTAGGETADSASRINAAMKMAEDWCAQLHCTATNLCVVSGCLCCVDTCLLPGTTKSRRRRWLGGATHGIPRSSRP